MRHLTVDSFVIQLAYGDPFRLTEWLIDGILNLFVEGEFKPLLAGGRPPAHVSLCALFWRCVVKAILNVALLPLALALLLLFLTVYGLVVWPYAKWIEPVVGRLYRQMETSPKTHTLLSVTGEYVHAVHRKVCPILPIEGVERFQWEDDTEEEPQYHD